LSAGDILVAVDGLRVTATNLDNLLSRYAVGESIQVMAFRRDELMSFDLVLQGDRVPGVTLTLESARNDPDRCVQAQADKGRIPPMRLFLPMPVFMLSFGKSSNVARTVICSTLPP
jgi:predicted metalloprotease with PDZ domain